MELPTKKTICLNMIVKDESHVIVDTLHNLWSYIQFDTYVISDTGSSDNTKALIKAFFDEKGITGTITDDAWLNFGHNRTVAFQHAYNKSDYVFVWDADDRIKGDFKLPVLDADSYSFSFGSYSRRQLFNNRKKWKYVGVLHECPSCCEQEGREEKVTGPYHFESNRTGARNKDPLKYLKDGQILEKAFYEALEAKDSIHMRYAYYCANSYNSTSTHKDKAIEFYKKVLTLENWNQEKYNSCIELFTIHDQQGKTQEALHWLVESHKYDKTRVEGVFRLIRHYCSNQPEVAFAYYTLIQDYVENKYLTDNIAVKLFVKNTEYEFYLPYFMIIVADKVKRKEVGAKMFEILFQKAHVPGEWWTRNIFTNIQFFLDFLPKTPAFFLSMTNYFDACKKAGHTFTEEHNRIVDKVLTLAKPVLGSLEQLSCSFVPSNKNPKENNIRIMFSITTCKRLDLFQKTIASILKCWTDLDQVDYFYCVDDNSSEEDRAIMRQSFPFFDYLMKGPDQRGHMKSMNLIWAKLQDVKPTYWIHMEDDWLFFKQEAYVSRAMKVLESYKDQKVHQVVFNRNYGLMMTDMNVTGGRMLDPMTRLHIKIDQQPGRHSGFWPHYSLQPSMCRAETILSLGDYTTPNKSFERNYANKYFAKGFQTAFFEGIYSLHIGKQHWETEGQNAYALNAEIQFNSQIQKNQSPPSNIIVEPEQQKQQKQQWQPLTYPKFYGTMANHLDQLKGLLVQKIPFALIRPSDGEYSVIKGQTLTNCDKWTFQAGGTLQTDLLQAVQTDVSGLYVGIPCNTCNKSWNCTQQIYDDYRSLVKTQNITYANLFMNANWPAFITMLKEDTRPLYVVTSGSVGTTELSIKGRHIIDSLLVNKWDEEGVKETARILDFVKTKNNSLICFSAGPLSKVWIPKCWTLNPTNTYLDVGAALDPFTKGPTVKSRFYTDREHPFAKEACQFRDRNLTYMCVFYNKDYIKLLTLLFSSIRFYSNVTTSDFLVLTSKTFEPLIQDLAKQVNIPIHTMTLDIITIFQAASARLSIFDYEHIQSYNKILYLDTDILVKGDLSTLFQLPLTDKVYALESGFTDSINFGVQFFTPPVKTAGFNSGTLLFPNSPTIQSLFERIRLHITTHTNSGLTPPYALDQPFINYHAIKDGLYENQTLKPYIALYEDNDVPTNEHTAIVCHFSFPIGNFAHKYNRMKTYFNRYLNYFTIEDKLQIVDILKGKRFSWDTGFIEFQENQVLLTKWGKGTYEFITVDTVRCVWNNHYHVLRFSGTSYFGVRTWPNDYVMARGHLL